MDFETLLWKGNGVKPGHQGCVIDLGAPRGDEETEAYSMVQTMRNGAEEVGPTTQEEEGDTADDRRVPQEEAPHGSTGWMERARMLGGQSGTPSFSASPPMCYELEDRMASVLVHELRG